MGRPEAASEGRISAIRSPVGRCPGPPDSRVGLVDSTAMLRLMIRGQGGARAMINWH